MENWFFLHVLRNLNSSAFQKSQYLAFLLFFAAFSLPKTALRRLPPPTAVSAAQDRPRPSFCRPELFKTFLCRLLPLKTAQDRSKPAIVAPVLSKTAQDSPLLLLLQFKTFLWCSRPSCGVQDLPVVFKTFLWCSRPSCAAQDLPVVFKTFLCCPRLYSCCSYPPWPLLLSLLLLPRPLLSKTLLSRILHLLPLLLLQLHQPLLLYSLRLVHLPSLWFLPPWSLSLVPSLVRPPQVMTLTSLGSCLILTMME